MRYTTNKELQKFLVELADKGWGIEKGRKHMKLRAPSGGTVFCSFTPSCPRAVMHIRKDCERMERMGRVK